MGASKRKRESMDSAIADMSSEDSFLIGKEARPRDYRTQVMEPRDSVRACGAERSKSDCALMSIGFNGRHCGMAASWRARSGATSQMPPPASILQVSERNAREGTNGTVDQFSDTFLIEASQTSNDEARTQLPAHKVNKNNAERKQTPQQEHTFTQLSNPPQTVENTDDRTNLQSFFYISANERGHTTRQQEPLIKQVNPFNQRPRAKSFHRFNNKREDTAPVENCNSSIVRLSVPLTSKHQENGLSMSFTGLFSQRQKNSDNHDVSSSSRQIESFIAINDIHDHEPEIFAQPRPDPILADSQDIFSSQTELDSHGRLTFNASGNLPELLANSISARGRLDTPQWVSGQDKQRSFAAVSPEALSQRPKNSKGYTSPAPNKAFINDSWQTQPTLPWCPPWNALSPCGTQQTLEPTNQSVHASQATTIDEDPLFLLSFSSGQQLNKHQLHDIAHQLLTYRTLGSSKPEPAGQPLVWADTRMELCETLHYFRSYQGTSHSSGGFAKGFMLDGFAQARDYVDSSVVIAGAGSGQTEDKYSDGMRASHGQVEDSTSQGLKSCMNHYNPVVIIVKVDNPHVPSKPPHQYCVLDYFKPTHIWVEKSGSDKLVRYRFERLNTKEDSWWRPKHIKDPIELGSLPPPFTKSCGTCARESPQIYLNNWMCLQPTCGSFWRVFPSGPDSSQGSEPFEPDEASLVYDPRFLKARTPWPNDDHEYPLTSNDVMIPGYVVPGENASEAFIRGVVCPLCGRCNSRMAWTGWECQNSTCNWKSVRPHKTISAMSLREPLWPLTYGYTPSRDTHSPFVTVKVSFAYNYRINRYTIPGIEGFITHMIANKTVIEESGGPDSMFEDLQQTDIGLRRRLIDNGQLKSDMYTRNFLVNYGMPYRLAGANTPHPFSSAARPITATRSRLNWAVKYLLSRESSFTAPASTSSQDSNSSLQLREFEEHDFNALIALACFESQKFTHDDDSRAGLGPTIAILNLGAPGTMRIRLQSKHHLGVSSAGLYTDVLPLPGCNNYVARLANHDALQAIKNSDAKRYRKRLKELPREMKLKTSGHAKDVLKMELGHGDVVVMHGKALQRYYEHAIEHKGKLRFTLTCRYINPDCLNPDEKPPYPVDKDDGSYDGAALGDWGEGRGSAMDHTLT